MHAIIKSSQNLLCTRKNNIDLQSPEMLEIDASALLEYKNRSDVSPSYSTGKFTKLSNSRQKGFRVVLKNGACNIFPSKISRKRIIRDIFTTLVDFRWRWTLSIFTLGFFASWLLFAVLWWLIAISHGDLEELHLPMNQAVSNWTPCVLEIYGFTSCFLFSVETQHTTGYGQRTPTELCPEAIFLMCVQNIAGLIIEGFLVGIVFAKMTRPKLRTQTLQFSKYAVICKRDDILCLLFRVGDMRKKSRIIEAKIKAQLIRPRKTKEGEMLNNYQTKLSITADDCEGDLFLIWPMTIVHKLDKKSPLYHISARDMLQESFEIIVTLEGTVESTGQKTQARSSYLASEVLWGHIFQPIVAIDKEKQGFKIDYKKFDVIVAVDTPLCSAAELTEFYKKEIFSKEVIRERN